MREVAATHSKCWRNVFASQRNDRRVSNRGDMLSFGCPLSVSLLPRLTVSPSYDGGTYTSGYLYLISSRRCCRPAAAASRALGSGLPSTGRMATSRHGTAPRAVSPSHWCTPRLRPLCLSLCGARAALLGTSTARPHTRHSRRR